jgi:choline-sulfatase
MPNILLILADQLSWKALRAYGNTDSLTPNLDALAARAARFTDCYTPSPLCTPARASLWTGRFPHETGIVSNGRNYPCGPVPADMPTLGQTMTAAGYQASYFGKGHDSGALAGFTGCAPHAIRVEPVGAFPVNADTFKDRGTTEQMVRFLGEEARAPFVAVAALNNPHNICGYVGAYAGPHDNPPDLADLPPLPDNFDWENPELVPDSVRYVCCAHQRQAQTAGWTAANWRHYLAAYYHYLGRVDAEIGRILDALYRRPDADDTAILFFADHGDGMAAHGLATKHTALYDEATRVPLLLAGPGIAPGPVGGLVSLMDVLPTVCDLGGAATPDGLWGRSLLPWARGAATGSPHDAVMSMWHTEWGFTVEPGRMMRTERYKYTRFAEGGAEELYDLATDPGETRTLTADPAHADVLAAHRARFARMLRETGDPFLDETAIIDPRWRAHPPLAHPVNAPAACMV